MSCFAHCHMTPQEFGVYKYIEAITHDSGIFYCNAKAVAAAFSGREWRTFQNLIDSLADKGWLRVVKASTRDALGRNTSTHYALATHDEWAKSHGENDCREPLQQAAMESVAAECNGQPLQQAAGPLQRATSSVATGCNKGNKPKSIAKNNKEKPKQPAIAADCNGLSGQSEIRREFVKMLKEVGDERAINLLPVPEWVTDDVLREHGQWLVEWIDRRKDIRKASNYWKWAREEYTNLFSKMAVANV